MRKAEVRDAAEPSSPRFFETTRVRVGFDHQEDVEDPRTGGAEHADVNGLREDAREPVAEAEGARLPEQPREVTELGGEGRREGAAELFVEELEAHPVGEL